MNTVKILRVSFKNIPLYKGGGFSYNLLATDRVSQKAQVYPIKEHIATQKLSAVIGINASGKTSTLKLLYFAMAIVLNNDTPNRLTGGEFIQDGTEMQVVFIQAGKCYELSSLFGIKIIERSGEEKIYFRDETLRVMPLSKSISKTKVLHLEENASLLLQRSAMSQEIRSMMQEDFSIVQRVTQDNDTSLRQLISMTNLNIVLTRGRVPSEVLHAFDPVLDELSIASTEKGTTYTVRFGNQKEPLQFHTPLEVEQVLSSGTIKGQNMMPFVRDVLMTGGYLFVDELENHMNKELLRMIMKIFQSENTNPKGACLIFSTHYAEALDFLERKDNIYIVRRTKEARREIELVNYADAVRRSDIKKSEIILSNYIGGTAPMYENMRALEEYLCQIHA